MLSAQHRLRDSADFASTVRGRSAVRAGSPLLVVHANQTDARAAQPPRVGLVVSKAVGGAVQRNRTKRRLRHALRDRVGQLPAGVDVVVRANPPAGTADYGTLGAELDRLLARTLAKVAR
ncbi:ribonuclease P protein component [Arsenicicoccus sp. oral taxon 190]|uniref:ribonuclease P protein component n=1 Tax=Arsenicicoccus sp. oral taxon 190 TaxID=1658671 RepID=UPI000679FA2A|nr:ribonuclease P protein component [Arsenicicoccus sp. oral taxon 190]AKT50855.1 ribonuclease P [Arsenicicoccus sp. oral taxon 190]